MTRTLRSLSAAALVLSAALTLSACVGGPIADPDASTSAPRASSPVATPQPSPITTSDAAPTCDTIIPQTTIDEFKKVGWSSQEVPFQLGSIVLSDGVECRWADFSVPSDNLQIFGWAPITGDRARAARKELLASGWRQIDGPDGVYVTENPETTVSTDADGFGMTYLFGTGWVKVADTKQGLLLVDWPST